MGLCHTAAGTVGTGGAGLCLDGRDQLPREGWHSSAPAGKGSPRQTLAVTSKAHNANELHLRAGAQPQLGLCLGCAIISAGFPSEASCLTPELLEVPWGRGARPGVEPAWWKHILHVLRCWWSWERSRQSTAPMGGFVGRVVRTHICFPKHFVALHFAATKREYVTNKSTGLTA